MTNQEINVKCAKAMGWKLNHPHWPDSWYTGSGVVEKWNPAESIADAWVLIEWAKKKGADAIIMTDQQNHCCVSVKIGTEADGYGSSDETTAPAAISLAFLEWAKEAK